MQHPDPESLGLAALGEQLERDEQAHVAACEFCAVVVEQLRTVVRVARQDIGRAPLEAPGPGVWEGIHRELGLQPAQAQDPLMRPTSEQYGRSGTQSTSGAFLAGSRGRRAHRPSLRHRYLLGAAAVGMVTGGGLLWAVQSLLPDEASGTVAEAVLEPLDGFRGEGTAAVVDGADGVRSLEVTSTGNEADGYEEVWLITPALDRMYSLGVLRDGTGSLTMPDGIDLEEFPIVDISEEPLDGDPTHSGVSVLRGSLTATVPTRS